MIRTLSFCCLLVAAMTGASLAQEAVSVAGSFNYTPEVFAQIPAGDTVFFDASEDEVWIGDIEGTAVSPFRMVVTPDGSFDAWLYTEFKGTVLGEHEGTMVVLSRYTRPAASAHWTGEWMILSGTGGLENAHGHGAAWGPGNNAADPDAGPEIFYSGEVLFVTE